MSAEMGLELTKQEFRFGYSFTTLVFATLALSVQFSPNYGDNWPYLLIVSWGCLLISALLGGYRVMYKVHFMHLNVYRNEREQAGDAINYELANVRLKNLNTKLVWVINIQITFFIIGILFNLGFASINYLDKGKDLKAVRVEMTAPVTIKK